MQMGNYGWETVVFFCRRYHLVFSCHTGFDFFIFFTTFYPPTAIGGYGEFGSFYTPNQKTAATFSKKDAWASPIHVRNQGC